MGVRDAKLCDTNAGWGGTVVLCDDLAVGTCVLCQRDYCLQHGMHSHGGLVLKAESWTVVRDNAQAPLREVTWDPNNSNGSPPPVPTLRIPVCKACRQAFDHVGSTSPKLSKALEVAGEAFVSALSAQLAAYALDETK